jgi:hypothetical protein
MSNTDVEQMLEQAESYVRRNPGLVLGGCIALGFALGRFLKSSPPARAGKEA